MFSLASNQSYVGLDLNKFVVKSAVDVNSDALRSPLIHEKHLTESTTE